MPDGRRLTELLDQRPRSLALVIGNGINIHNADKVNSGDQLLLRIAHDPAVDVPDVPKGTALTEFYDVLELKRRPKVPPKTTSLRRLACRRSCRLVNAWKPKPHHEAIMGWAMRHEVPVLTTNSEEVLSDAAKCRFHRPSGSPFTDYCPWECRFAHAFHDDPCAGFGIWHINGMRRYRRSIRLGLSHYMGSVQRAQTWLHRGDANLFRAKNRVNWEDATS